MCKTPICQAVEEHIRKQYAPMHMPGHKGKLPDFLKAVAPYDLTEVAGLDSLYEADGCIAQCEAAYARRYGSCLTLLSAGGSTLCIQTMLALVARRGGTLIAGRNIHISGVHTMGLLGLSPRWLYPDSSGGVGIAGRITAEAVKMALEDCPNAVAVYITTPDYFGVLSPVEEIATVCHKKGVPLLIDNAHGACLNLFSPSLHPMDLGADACCDSLHKTLPVLTGGALLHLKNEAFAQQAKGKMSLFGSTSPSYLILQSVDMAESYLATTATQEWQELALWVKEMQTLAASSGFAIPQGKLDPCKLALGFAPLGYDAPHFRSLLNQAQIEPEYLSEHFCVFMPTPQNSPQDLRRVQTFLEKILPIGSPLVIPTQYEQVACATSLQEALFAEQETISVEDSVGRIAGEVCSRCPPGIPLLIPGEIIHKDFVKVLKTYGIYKLNVLK